MVLVVLPRLFARCLALEGLSHSEVVSVSWDPHPWEPVKGGLGRRGVRSAFLVQTRQSLVSLPLSALVLEPRSGVRREATTWLGCGVAGSSSRELSVGRVVEAAVAPCCFQQQ
ncbi:hypothetical protein Taro_028708 [Colocasia esculenta]|uniref:Secreted protein n=1 Tax=Colocasia esculenta TaxID=4460 RepID=A0A843VUZ1_COLES|nr:hypothetical protein [Colocasia esculenta]